MDHSPNQIKTEESGKTMSKAEARDVEGPIPEEEEEKEKEQPSKVSVYVSVRKVFWDLEEKAKATFGWVMLDNCNNNGGVDMCLLDPVPEMSTGESTQRILDQRMFGHFNCKLDPPPSSLPPGLISLDHYECAAHESKIYIIGGKNRFTREYSRELFIYDTTTKTWDTQPSKMNTNRAAPGLEVVAVENAIYVFGGELDGPFTGKNWAERCVLSDNSWKWTLLKRPNDRLGITKGDPYLSYLTLYEHRQQILLWVAARGGADRLYSYHYRTEQWSAFNEDIELFYPTRNYKMAVVGDLLYCHYFGMIYAYHLKEHRVAGLYDLSKDFIPADLEKFGKPLFKGDCSDNGFLVHTGKGNLFVMCFHGHGNDLHCYKFQISNDDDSDKDGGGARAAAAAAEGSIPTLPLTFKGTKSIPTCANLLKHALVVA